MTALSRPVLRWHGGKWRLAPWIISLMPSHDAYVEPFGGGASVLLRKQRSKLEVYNDLDRDLVNLFAVLRDDPQRLAAEVALTPFSRNEFDQSYQVCDDRIECARRMLIRSHMGFGSNAVNRRSGFRAAGLRSGVLPVHNWCDMPQVIRDVAERMRGVVIENRDACDVMRANDGPGAVHYVDPPYMMGVRSDASPDYAHEMTEDQHLGLLDCLCSLDGQVILSGYASDLYDSRLTHWHRVERSALADGAARRIEVIWTNFRPQQELLL